jgi:hypothetical protein
MLDGLLVDICVGFGAFAAVAFVAFLLLKSTKN